jgi:hypothetical protein
MVDVVWVRKKSKSYFVFRTMISKECFVITIFVKLIFADN